MDDPPRSRHVVYSHLAGRQGRIEDNKRVVSSESRGHTENAASTRVDPAGFRPQGEGPIPSPKITARLLRSSAAGTASSLQGSPVTQPGLRHSSGKIPKAA